MPHIISTDKKHKNTSIAFIYKEYRNILSDASAQTLLQTGRRRDAGQYSLSEEE